MEILLLIVHITVCLSLIGIVLIQGGKGSEMGAAFGGSSQTLFGSRGAATFLGKVTTVVAVVFMVTSLLLALVSVKKSSVSSSGIIDKLPVEEKSEEPKQNVPENAGVKPTEGPIKEPPKK